MHYYHHGTGITGDVWGLGDAFVVRCPAPFMYQAGWRTGHIGRMVPAEYDQSLKQGKNLISDPALHALLDDVWLVVRGPVWSKERFKAIWRLNCWKPSHKLFFNYDFSNSDMVRYKRFGEYESAASGRWLSQRSGIMQFGSACRIHSSVAVTIKGMPFCWSGMPEQTLEIYFKGKHLADFPYSDQKPLRELKFAIPEKLLSDGKFRFEFKFKTPLKSPKELGINQETRTLGFFFQTINITSIH